MNLYVTLFVFVFVCLIIAVWALFWLRWMMKCNLVVKETLFNMVDNATDEQIDIAKQRMSMKNYTKQVFRKNLGLEIQPPWEWED